MHASNLITFSAFLVALFCYFLWNAGAQVTDPKEVSALKTIKNSLNDPIGNLNSWNIGDPCTSNWNGIFCYPTANNGYLHVQQLQLLKLNLSGSLALELGHLSQLQILDVMWNKINGTIPKEIGNISSLKLLLLSGNELSGTLPDEIGYLVNLNRLQIDLNQISGLIPKSFANLRSIKHLHMNNNSLSGQIPSELSTLPHLLHLLVDNNNLSGYLPSEFSMLPHLKILQLDNNNFNGNTIPASYGNMGALIKLSLRNCSLRGFIPDFSGAPELTYLDLSRNNLAGSIPSKRLSENVTTIKLASNQLQGSIPSNFFGLPLLQILSLSNNRLNGSVPSSIWQDKTYNGNRSLIFDFQNNLLTNITKSSDSPTNFTILLYGNPLCANPVQANFVNCKPQTINPISGSTTSSRITCQPCPTDLDYEYNPLSPIPCLCAIPLGVGFRLKSPGISDFHPYIEDFRVDLSSLLDLHPYQLYFNLYTWEEGPRMNMYLNLFPDNTCLFNTSEVVHIRRMLTGWEITLSDVFGPYELLNFTMGSYANSESKEPLSFMMRLRIALETARGILYLHAEADPPVFHRDIKASNILLDSKYTAKVADFGISRLAPLPTVEGVSADHVSTVVKGTPGYLDPEYFLTHKLTDKSDVYSLGVVFLELLTGMQPISLGKNLVREVSMAYQCGRIFEIIDSRMGPYPSDCIDKFVSLAYSCCQDQPDARPSMSEIVRELEIIWRMIPKADILHSEISIRDPDKASAPLFSTSSSSALTDPYLSYDVSGSNLHSSAVPNIKPR